ncbi:MAG: indole-3-glycerol phosphate synthase TrpC [PVC group bacterium]
MMSDFLGTIRRLKEGEIAARRAGTPLNELRARIRDLPPARDFEEALRRPGLSLVAEIKRSSPSAGAIAGEIDPARLGRLYQEGGAAAVSVLTENYYFGGSLEDLRITKEAVTIPVLRKDFILDEYQVYESRCAGADAVLLIAEMLDREQLKKFLRVAGELGLSCLVESHGRGELKKTIDCPASIIGINNRDLNTLEVDLETSLRLLPLIPEDRVRVAESGIRTAGDVRRLAGAGADAILVGETLVRSDNVKATIKELINM